MLGKGRDLRVVWEGSRVGLGLEAVARYPGPGQGVNGGCSTALVFVRLRLGEGRVRESPLLNLFLGCILQYLLIPAIIFVISSMLIQFPQDF
jgi:hypothetical protein